jgi:hypothetical protein
VRLLTCSHYLQAGASDPQALRKGQRYPNRIGRALRHVHINCEEDPWPGAPGNTSRLLWSNPEVSNYSEQTGALCVTRAPTCLLPPTVRFKRSAFEVKRSLYGPFFHSCSFGEHMDHPPAPANILLVEVLALDVCVCSDRGQPLSHLLQGTALNSTVQWRRL